MRIVPTSDPRYPKIDLDQFSVFHAVAILITVGGACFSRRRKAFEDAPYKFGDLTLPDIFLRVKELSDILLESRFLSLLASQFYVFHTFIPIIIIACIMRVIPTSDPQYPRSILTNLKC